MGGKLVCGGIREVVEGMVGEVLCRDFYSWCFHVKSVSRKSVCFCFSLFLEVRGGNIRLRRSCTSLVMQFHVKVMKEQARK